MGVPRLLDTDDLYVGPRQPGAPITYWNADGDLAHVRSTVPSLTDMVRDEIVRTVAESWEITDDNGVVFSLHRYEPAEHPSYVVLAPHGAPLATFLCEGGVLHDHVLVRDDAAAPVAEVETRHHSHDLRARGGDRLASCRRVLDTGGNDSTGEVWHFHVEPGDDAVLDRRALLAMPLVCQLVGHPRRHVDPDCTVALILLYVAPPVGATALAVERAIDGLHWLRRKLD